MKKPKRRLTKAQRAKLLYEQRRRAALNLSRQEASDLAAKLQALGDFDANAPHIKLLARLVLELFDAIEK